MATVNSFDDIQLKPGEIEEVVEGNRRGDGPSERILPVIPTHDLDEIHALFTKEFDLLNGALRLLKESQAAVEASNTPENRQAVELRFKDFARQCSYFQERLPKRLPPFVRDDLWNWNKRDIGATIGMKPWIRFGIKEDTRLEDFDERLQAEIKGVGGRELWRLSENGVFGLYYWTDLAVIWPDLEAIKATAEAAFKAYETLAKKRPEDFRLEPHQEEEEVVDAIVIPPVIPTHDLDEIHTRFTKSFESLKKPLCSLKESYDAFDVCNPLEAWRGLKARAEDWIVQCNDFRERLPKRLPPFVRDDLWGKRGIGKHVQIDFKLKKGFLLRNLDKELRAEIKKAGGRKSWRLPLSRAARLFLPILVPVLVPVLPDRESWQLSFSWTAADVFLHPDLTAIWPDLEAIKTEAKDAFKTYEALAKERPEDFRLKPRRKEEVVEEIVRILTPLERPGNDADWPGKSDEDYYAYLLSKEGLFDPGEPTTGATLKRLCDGLRERWSDITDNQIKYGLMEALGKGLIRVHEYRGGNVAHERGYAQKDREIVDGEQLEQWLELDRAQRPFEIKLRLRSGGKTAAAEAPTDKPEPVCPVILGDPDKLPTVFGKVQEAILSDREHHIVKVLVQVWPGRLSISEIEHKSSSTEPSKVLSKLKKKSPEWERAISMAGSPGRGYGLAINP